MKRFRISVGDGHDLRLYYPTLEVAQRYYPDAEIVEDDDQSHVVCIEQMLDSAVDCETIDRSGSTVYLLRFETPVGICLAELSRDNSDGVWYDLCKYQLWKSGAVVVPVTRTISTPANFCKEFLIPKSEYTVLCTGRKLQKPKELKGGRKFASIPFEGRSQCQLFLDGNDLYINHSDYFSQMWRPPDGDIGKPTSYYLKKYFGISKPEKFVYADSWGAIVITNRAWLRITNFVQLVKHLSSVQVAATVWPMIRKYHQWSASEYNMGWECFLEAVSVVTKQFLSEEVL